MLMPVLGSVNLHTYMSVCDVGSNYQVEAAALYHHGNPQSGTGYSIYSCLDQTFDLSICNQLHPVFGPNANLSQQDLERQPMFAVAMEENLDKEHSTKVLFNG